MDSSVQMKSRVVMVTLTVICLGIVFGTLYFLLRPDEEYRYDFDAPNDILDFKEPTPVEFTPPHSDGEEPKESGSGDEGILPEENEDGFDAGSGSASGGEYNGSGAEESSFGENNSSGNQPFNGPPKF